jgi:hypothetical protein
LAAPDAAARAGAVHGPAVYDRRSRFPATAGSALIEHRYNSWQVQAKQQWSSSGGNDERGTQQASFRECFVFSLAFISLVWISLAWQ